MRMRNLLLAWLACVAWTSIAPARDIYVNNETGDDRLEGRSAVNHSQIEGPVRTLAKALRLAQAADRIVVAKTAQPYREAIGLMGSKNSGLPGVPFVIEGNGATLDGSAAVPADSWTYHGGDVFCFRPDKLGYQQLFSHGRPAVRRPTTPAAVSLPALEPLEWCLWEGQIFFRVENGQLPDAYDLSCCHLRAGITLYHVHDVIIDGFVIQGFQLDGVNASDVVGKAMLSDLTCRGNGRSGILVGGASRVVIDQCTLGDNGIAQLLSEDYSHTELVESTLIDNTAPGIVVHGGRVTVDDEPLHQSP